MIMFIKLQTLSCVLVLLLFAVPALAEHKVSHNPPGNSPDPNLVCDCMIVEVGQSVRFHRSEIDPNLKDIIGGLMVRGALECFVNPDPGFPNFGEATYRAILDLLGDDPNVCL